MFYLNGETILNRLLQQIFAQHVSLPWVTTVPIASRPVLESVVSSLFFPLDKAFPAALHPTRLKLSRFLHRPSESHVIPFFLVFVSILPVTAISLLP